MITYNDIYESLRKERYSDNLQALGKNFIKDVSEYLEEKKAMTEKKSDLFSDSLTKTKKQFENAITIFKELMTRRKKKILNLAFIARETGITKKDFENMLDFEREMFDKVVKSMEKSDRQVSDMLNGKKQTNKNTHLLVNFKEKVEPFLDTEGEQVGPFVKGDLANLPEEIVSILAKDNKVDIIEEE